MGGHLLHFSIRVFDLWLHHYGTTIVAFSCGLVPPVISVYRRFKGGVPARTIWREIGIGALIMLAIWFALLVFCIGEAVYRDHQYLVSVIERTKKEQETKLLQLSIRSVVFGDVDHQSTHLTLSAQVFNPGLPTTAHHWQLVIVAKGLTIPLVYIPGQEPLKGSPLLPRLDEKMERPLDTNVGTTGLLDFRLKGWGQSQLLRMLKSDPESKFVLSVLDGRNHECASEKTLAELRTEYEGKYRNR